MSLWRKGQDHDGILAGLKADDARAIEADVRAAHGVVFRAEREAYAMLRLVQEARSAGQAGVVRLSADELAEIAATHVAMASYARDWAAQRETGR